MQTKHSAPGRRPNKSSAPIPGSTQAVGSALPRGTPPALAGSAMTMRSLRWTSPAPAAAYFWLRDVAPLLTGLGYSRTIPDPTLQVILGWSERVVATDVNPSFGLDKLQEPFPDVVVVFEGEHTHARGDPGEGGGGRIDLYDRSCGALVTKVMWLRATLAAALHSDEGGRFVTAARADLAGHFDRIAALNACR